jgi:uncharacterized membrane protein HdeD (DUF308 family)
MESTSGSTPLSKWLNPWWSNLLQGLIFILLSFIVFSNPVTFLGTIALWLGILVLLCGLSGIALYLASKPGEKNIWSLVGGVVAGLLGLIMISRVLITVKAITVVFGLLILFFGIHILVGSVGARKESRFWWIPSLLGLLAIITGVQSVLRMQEGAQAIAFIMGVSLLLTGVGLLILALTKKKMGDPESMP